jgi:hypothetical protein
MSSRSTSIGHAKDVGKVAIGAIHANGGLTAIDLLFERTTGRRRP